MAQVAPNESNYMHTNTNTQKVSVARKTQKTKQVIRNGWESIVVYDPSRITAREMRGNRVLLAALKVWEAKHERGLV